MATIKSYSDIEQSKKLAEILPIESADGGWYSTTNPYAANTHLWLGTKYSTRANSPAWSLAALLSVLPEELEDNNSLTLQKEKNEYCCCYEDINGDSFTHTFADNPIDACYEMVILLNELNLL